jgi:hypothetical protein
MAAPLRFWKRYAREGESTTSRIRQLIIPVFAGQTCHPRGAFGGVAGKYPKFFAPFRLQLYKEWELGAPECKIQSISAGTAGKGVAK